MKKKSKKTKVKQPKLRKRHININSNILLDKWIWISLAFTIAASITMFITFFIFKKNDKISLSYPLLIVIAIAPLIIYILYWTTMAIFYRLLFKAITKDIEKDAVFPIPSSFLIQDQETSVKNYITKGNLKKIKAYKTQETKLLIYTIIIVVLFIIFNFIFVGLTQLRVITISTSWIYLFGLLSNVISLILSGIFGFMVSNIINSPNKFKARYLPIQTKIYKFKAFLNLTNLKKLNHHELKYSTIDFLPLYFYQSLLISHIKQEQFINELESWKYYLTLSSYLNQFSWLVFLHHSLNKEDQLKLIKRSKYMTRIATQIKRVHTILFHTENDFIYFNNDYKPEELETAYNKLMSILYRYKNRFTLKMITSSLEKNGLKINQTINENKDDNIIDERDVDINFYQLNYFEYLFSIIFTNDKDIKSNEHFKY